MCACFVSLVFGCLDEKSIFHLTYQKSSKIFRYYLCRPLSGVGETKNLQYPSNTPKYTTLGFIVYKITYCSIYLFVCKIT